MKRSNVLGFTEGLALCRWFRKSTALRLSGALRTVFFSLILQFCIMTGFPATGFGGTLTADFSMSPPEGPAPLGVAFKDKSAPS